jgi:lipoate-protein ligase A
LGISKIKWRLIVDDALDSALNMAIDEALLLHCQENKKTSLFPSLRFFCWKTPTLSLGYAQEWKKTVDLDYCKSQGIDIVRRPTGGRAVLHDKELTYSVVAQCEGNFFSKSTLETYRHISAALVCGFNNINIPAQLAIPHLNHQFTYKLTNKPCFFSTSKYELAYRGKKMVGSAQKRLKNSFLQHGSILLEVDKERLISATGIKNKGGAGADFIALNDVAAKKIVIEELIEALSKGFEEYFSIQLAPDAMSDREVNLAQKLQKEKYSQSWWNFGR